MFKTKFTFKKLGIKRHWAVKQTNTIFVGFSLVISLTMGCGIEKQVWQLGEG